MLRRVLALSLLACLFGCSTTPDGDRPPGKHGCEVFFIYELCVSDLDKNGNADYMYFDDSKEIFMYHESMKTALNGVMAFHRCAIPMSDSTRDYASQLLYGDELGLSARLRIKGKLITQYRAAQPAVDACNMSGSQQTEDVTMDEDPFLADEDWEDGEF